MEKLHFINIGNNKWIIIIYFLALLCLIFGGFEIIDFQNHKINKYILLTGQWLIVISLTFTSGFLYKNSVVWNKKGMNVRMGIRTLFGTDIKFDNVDKAELQEDELLVVENGIEKRINLSKIRPEDRKKLLSIILEHIED